MLCHCYGTKWIQIPLYCFFLYSSLCVCQSSTIIDDIWTDDFAFDNQGIGILINPGLTGWNIFNQNQYYSPKNTFITGDAGKQYHGFFSKTSHSYNYMSRTFQCEKTSDIWAYYTYTYCGTDGDFVQDYPNEDYAGIYKIYDIGSSSSLWKTGLDIGGTELVTSSGDASFYSQAVAICGADPIHRQSFQNKLVLLSDDRPISGFTAFEVWFEMRTNAVNEFVAIHDIKIECDALPTAAPSISPTISPNSIPTMLPTNRPSFSPTLNPTNAPTLEPTLKPTMDPTNEPTSEPTNEPTSEPTNEPTSEPTNEPTSEPTNEPTSEPTNEPTSEPTNEPTSEPTNEPTSEPTKLQTFSPSISPIRHPTIIPTTQPSTQPMSEPTENPSMVPTSYPTKMPSLYPIFDPTISPTKDPSIKPIVHPTNMPSKIPSQHPTDTRVRTEHPSVTPTQIPSILPTINPTNIPSTIPTSNPTTSPTSNPTTSPTSNPSKTQ
eukprot:187238_1